MARAFIAALLVTVFAAPSAAQGGASSGGDVQALRSRVERRFQILPLANGVLLTPRFKAAARSIEIGDGTIAVDGMPVTGSELRQKLGADADVILQLSYLDAESKRSLAGLPAPTTASPQTPPMPPRALEPPIAPEPPPGPDAPSRIARTKRRQEVVRVGGSVKVARDEHVAGDVVAVGGSADIDGLVDGDVVTVGGSANLGPSADVRGDVVVVGGTLNQDPNAIVGGSVHNVGIGAFPLGGDWGRRRNWSGWSPFGGFRPVAQFIGTTVRVGLLMLFAALVMFVARTPVEQIADRAEAEPIKSWIVGFLAQILFVPVLVLTVFVLAVSIIGIPLLLLVPVAIVAAILAFLVGFTGIAYSVGRLLQSRFDQLRARPYLATLAGIVLIVSPLLLARVVGLTGDMRLVAGILIVIGVIVEYVAWTTGLGAAALVRFVKPTRPPVETMPPSTVGL